LVGDGATDFLLWRCPIIPPFTDSGLLPPGIHPASLAEIERRFGILSEVRHAQMESVRWMIDLAIRAGAQRIVLNGSFVTDIIEPNDVDCVLLFMPGQRKDKGAFNELNDGLPFLDITLAAPEDFQEFVSHVFAADRLGASKGMIEVIT
jgi:hypothetical protein